MIFWLAVLAGALFAWIAVRIGFFATWIMFFHLVLAACMAIFLTPEVVASIPEATAIHGYGHALTMLSVAAAALFIAYGTCYACLSGRISMPFPRFFDTIVAGVIGFQAGFFAWSFLVLVFSLTPLSQLDFFKRLEFDQKAQRANTAYVCWWSDVLHSFIAPLGDESTSRKAVELLQQETAPPVPETPLLEEPLAPPPVPTVAPSPDVDLAPRPVHVEPTKTVSGNGRHRGKDNAVDPPENKAGDGDHPQWSTIDDPFR